MSDNIDDDLEGDGSEASAPAKKKSSILGKLIPTILKFAAIGIAALVFIVTVSVITFNIMKGGGRPATNTTDPTSPYIGRRPIFSHYTGLGAITVRTKDVAHYSVSVTMNLAYDQNDVITSAELLQRQVELRDFVRRYFAGKSAEELKLENEPRLRREILDLLNNRFLDNAKVRDVNFDRLDVTEVF